MRKLLVVLLISALTLPVYGSRRRSVSPVPMSQLYLTWGCSIYSLSPEQIVKASKWALAHPSYLRDDLGKKILSSADIINREGSLLDHLLARNCAVTSEYGVINTA